ncbi:hypothetical protein AAG906_035408 [Vitis piasezkii]
MQEQNNEDLYNPIYLNLIFNDDDILDEWIREGEEPILSSYNLDWLDKDDGATSCRVSKRTSNATQKRDIDSCHKGKGRRMFLQGGCDIGGGNGGVGGTGEDTREDGGAGGGYVSQEILACHGHKEMKITLPHKI